MSSRSGKLASASTFHVHGRWAHLLRAHRHSRPARGVGAFFSVTLLIFAMDYVCVLVTLLTTMQAGSTFR